MATASESITNFLRARRESHNGPDLIDRYLAYGTDMETQVNVAAGNGERVPGTKSTYTSSDGADRWFSYRIPKNADSQPEFRDYELGFALDEHADAIGSTGWDWRAGVSRWVGFDFDSIVGHSAGIGITDEALAKVRDAAKALPYVEVRSSTSGGGIHLYVLLPEIKTANHTEHAALARCILGSMSRDAGFDFSAQIDACGGNLWIWSVKSTEKNMGLRLIKPAERTLSTDELPSNWRDHIEVIKRRRSKVRVFGVADEEQDPFEMLASAHRRIPLDEQHRLQIEEMIKTGASVNWVADYHLLQTHTMVFDKLMNGVETCDRCGGLGADPDHRREEFEVEFGVEISEPPACARCKGEGATPLKDRLKLQGIYETISAGSDPATPNCFAFPGDKGSWKIYRFSQGISEAKTWECDGRGWTTCWFNVAPNLRTAALGRGGRELAKGGYEFDTLKGAIDATKIISPNAELPIEPHLLTRPAIIRESKDGRIAIEIPKKSDDGDQLGDWNSSDKKSAWTQVFNVQAEPTARANLNVAGYDNMIRCLETAEGTQAGWSIKKHDGQWTRKNSASVKTILQRYGHKKAEAEEIMGFAEERPWKLVMLPFTPEYPGNRQWNLGAPQLRYQPISREEMEALGPNPHPHWDKILNHIGNDLTQHLKELDWAKLCGIRTGADYLRAILASIIREPFQQTPYLFLFGPENSGKSILHEAFDLLVTCGVVKADRALTNQSDFNGEIANAILCITEEKDISKTPGAHAKIKDAVTSLKLSIRKMRTDAYTIPNSTHWVQTANHQDACPVFDGDTRITMIYVPELQEQIPKAILLEKLVAEAPAFLRTLMDVELPQLTGRLRVPVVETEHKHRVQQLSKSSLSIFIEEHLHSVSGSMIEFAEFYSRFMEACPPEDKSNWTRVKVSKALPVKFPSGAGTGNKTFIINASWSPDTAPGEPLIVLNGRIKKLPS